MIKSGETKTIAEFEFKDRVEEFELNDEGNSYLKFSKRWLRRIFGNIPGTQNTEDIKNHISTQSIPNPTEKIELKGINLDYTYYNELGEKISENKNAYFKSKSKKTDTYYLTNKGILVESEITVKTRELGQNTGYLDSEAMYIAIIDNDQNNQEYSISHIINSEDFERFHIMIGAKQSCKATISFSFEIDNGEIISSNTFSLNIRNPVNSLYHKKYSDGIRLIKKDGSWILKDNERNIYGMEDLW